MRDDRWEHPLRCPPRPSAPWHDRDAVCGVFRGGRRYVLSMGAWLACPNPDIWARLRAISLKSSSFLDEDLVRVSPLYKFIVDIEDLTSPIVASKGIIEAIQAVGASRGEDRPFDLAEVARKSPDYEISGTHALE